MDFSSSYPDYAVHGTVESDTEVKVFLYYKIINFRESTVHSDFLITKLN